MFGRIGGGGAGDLEGRGERGQGRPSRIGGITVLKIAQLGRRPGEEKHCPGAGEGVDRWVFPAGGLCSERVYTCLVRSGTD